MKAAKVHTILLLWLSCSYAQEYNFKRLTEKDGMPANNTYSILKDQDGFMWFGTANGLCRYDGIDFTHFTQERGYDISNDHVNELIQDKDGIIWVGTNAGGLNAFNPKTNSFEPFTHDPKDPNSIAADRIQSIVEGAENDLWIGFDNGEGFSRLDKKTKIFTNLDPFKPFNLPGVKAIRDIVYDRKRDMVWLGTTNGIISYDPKKNSFELIDHPLSGENLHGLFALEQLDENRLIGGLFHAGVDIYDIEKGQWEGIFSNPSKKIRVFNLARKSETEYWVAARRKGLAVFNLENGQLEFVPSDFNQQNTPFPGFTYEVYGDSSEIWVGSNEGISFAHQKAPTFHFTPLDFPETRIGQVTEVTGIYNKLYMIGYANQLWEKDKRTGAINSYPISIESLERVHSILELEDRLYMIGNNEMILQYDKKTKQTTPLKVDLKVEKVAFERIERSKEDTAIIISRYGGTYLLDLTTNQISPFKPEAIPDQWQHDALVQDDGKLWIATSASILVYDEERDLVEKYNLDAIKSKRQKHVHRLAKDAKGNTWVATGHGIVKIENDQETLYNVLNSDLPGNLVLDINFDGDQMMWIQTPKGISKIDPSTMELIHYDRSDGIDPEGVLFEVDGEIYYGVVGGYYNLSQKKESPNSVKPEVFLTDFKIAGEQEVALDASINYSSQINLDYWQNSFSFSFTSPNHQEPSKLKFAYRLQGLSQEWSYDQKRRFANYTNLDGGNYRFEVKARSKDGLWSEVKSIPIIIASPFWETWWFYSLCGLFIFGSGLIFYKTRVNALQRKADQEAQELRLEAFQKRLMDLNAMPPDLVLKIEELNIKLNTPLSEREFEALKLSLDGKTNTEIGDTLFISNSTVKFHLRNAYSKLGVQNRKEALKYVAKTSSKNSI